jgi:hypothetical protein
MSQNITFTSKDKVDIEKIKQMLIEHKTQLDMSRELGLRRETVNRKIRRWVQTDDFENWLKTAWLQQYQNVDSTEAFRALTSLVGKMLTRKIERKEQIEISEEIVTVNVTENEDEILSKAASILSRKERFKQIH